MIQSVHKIIFTIAVIFLQVSLMTGQESGLTGRIMEGDTRWPVQLALVQNVSSRSSAYSDTSGFFRISADFGDTLVFSASGYYYRVLLVNDSLLNAKDILQFRMEPLVYRITEANVYAFSTYEHFKQQFINLDLSKEKTEVLRRNLQQQSLSAAREGDRIWQDKQYLEGARLASVPILSREEKHRMMLKEVLNRENHKNQVYEKYNPEIIRKITGLTDDNEIIRFMAYCNFSDAYILNTHAYDLMEMIARKYADYRRLKEGKGSDRTGEMPDHHTVHTS
ncbi:MAG: hypothetical protein JW973_12075 [Bacteroidales bacterium]|nr:hypothetical protein [Bacteroidales bacterium]